MRGCYPNVTNLLIVVIAAVLLLAYERAHKKHWDVCVFIVTSAFGKVTIAKTSVCMSGDAMAILNCFHAH